MLWLRQRNCNSKVATFIYAFFDYDVVPSDAPFSWTIKFKVMVDFINQLNESALLKLGVINRIFPGRYLRWAIRLRLKIRIELRQK